MRLGQKYTMFHFLKNKLFPAKEAIVNLFRYPRERIGVTPTYDAYWRSKRGENIGALSDWQKNRADIILKNMPRGENVSVLDIGWRRGDFELCETQIGKYGGIVRD